MAFTPDELAKANKLARDMKALLPKLHFAIGNLETLQGKDLSSLDLVGGGNPAEHLRIARKLLADASSEWQNAKRALRTDLDLLAGAKHYDNALNCFTQANATLVRLGANNADPKAEPPTKPIGKVDDKAASTPKPATPAQPTVNEDKGGDSPDPKAPKPAPVPKPTEAKDETGGKPQGTDLDKVLAAVNGVKDTCAKQHKELTERLDTLRGGTLQPERAKALRDLTDAQFTQLLAASDLAARIELLEEWRAGGLTLEDVKFFKGKRWNGRNGQTEQPVNEPRTAPTTH